MIKLANMFARDDDYTYREFIERWRRSHTGFAEEFPGLVRYATSAPIDPERLEYDGIVELYFGDMAALETAFDSGVGQRVNADAAAFTDMRRGLTLYVEETAHLDRS